MELYLISVLWLLIKPQKRGETSIILKGETYNNYVPSASGACDTGQYIFHVPQNMYMTYIHVHDIHYVTHITLE